MIHDPDLLDRLDALPKTTFDGEVFRATRQTLDPLASSYSNGRWMMRDGAAVLYTSLAREGALAEISFHWGQLTPRPTKPVLLHKLSVIAHRTLRLVRVDLAALGVPASGYIGVNLPRTQEIGAAVEFLGCDGLREAEKANIPFWQHYRAHCGVAPRLCGSPHGAQSALHCIPPAPPKTVY